MAVSRDARTGAWPALDARPPQEAPPVAKVRAKVHFSWRGQIHHRGEEFAAPLDDLAKLFRAGVISFL